MKEITEKYRIPVLRCLMMSDSERDQNKALVDKKQLYTMSVTKYFENDTEN